MWNSNGILHMHDKKSKMGEPVDLKETIIITIEHTAPHPANRRTRWNEDF
jgi:hypothetical protein